MASWRPQTDLEQEIISLQPDYNFIYGNLTDTQKKLDSGYHSRPPAHLEFLKRKAKKESNAEDTDKYANGLNAIREVQKMVGLKPLGEPVNIEDFDNLDNLDRETIAMIRYCGMGPTLDLPLNEKTTIPTLPLKKDLRIVRKGSQKLPVIFNDEYFKVESTRMRNAKLLESIDSMTNGIEGTQILDEQNSNEISVLKEEETKEPTEAEIAAKEHQEFLVAYPALGKNNDIHTKSVTNSSTKTKQKDSTSVKANLSTKKGRRKWRSIDSSLSSLNSSLSSFSIYNSCDSRSSSTYFSANESLSKDHTNGSVENGQNDASIGQSRFKSVVSPRQKRYYTPKEVYEMKRHN